LNQSTVKTVNIQGSRPWVYEINAEL